MVGVICRFEEHCTRHPRFANVASRILFRSGGDYLIIGISSTIPNHYNQNDSFNNFINYLIVTFHKSSYGVNVCLQSNRWIFGNKSYAFFNFRVELSAIICITVPSIVKVENIK